MTESNDLKNKKVLILDDEEAVCSLINDILEDLELEISNTGSVKEARALCEEIPFDLVILDYNVSDGIGWGMVEEIASDTEKYGEPACMFISGTIDFSFFSSYPSSLSTEFISKPFDVLEFRETVTKLLRK